MQSINKYSLPDELALWPTRRTHVKFVLSNKSLTVSVSGADR